jgi:hypothetical protein
MIFQIPVLDNLRAAVRTRALVAALVVHLGLAVQTAALVRITWLNGWDVTSTLVLVGTLIMYGGVLLATFFVLAPVWPWIDRLQKAETWATTLLRDLPTFLDHVPAIVASVEHLLVAWNESKKVPVNVVVKTDAPVVSSS